MHLRWRNGVFDVGWFAWSDAYGVSLAWGRRDMMGEEVREGETIFADHKHLLLATGRDVRIFGSLRRAVWARWLGK